MSENSMMNIIAYDGAGGPEVMRKESIAIPSLKPGQVLIRVHAAGVNRPDIAQRQGSYPPPPGAPEWPGLEVSGEVVAVSEVKNFTVGDKVMALLTGGGYAQYAIADEECVLPIPDNMDYVQAAAIPETYYTVWSNVFDRAKLQKGETLLVHGGSSGIGTVAIQLAKAFGAKVIVTAGSKEKCQACLDLGADFAINYREQDFVKEVKAITNNAGANVILDMIGGDYTERNYHAAAVEGRIIQIAVLRGNSTVNLMTLMLKRLVHTGSTLRARDKGFKGEITASLRKHVLPLWEQNRALPIIDKVYPFLEADKAHQHMEASNHIGKVILKLD